MILYNEKIRPILDDLENPEIELAGGSAVGMVLSITDSLISYICNLTIGKKKYENVQDEVIKIKKEAEVLREKALKVIDEDRVVSILEQNNINYIVLDKRNNYDVEEKDDNKNLNNYNKFYEKAKKEIAQKMRIEKIYQYLLLCKDEKIIYEVEKKINERRKIQGN